MFTRDMIQGFIDGYVTANGDPKFLSGAVSQYLGHHPIYTATTDDITQILSDLVSYRVTPQDELAPVPVAMKPSPVLNPVPDLTPGPVTPSTLP